MCVRIKLHFFAGYLLQIIVCFHKPVFRGAFKKIIQQIQMVCTIKNQYPVVGTGINSLDIPEYFQVTAEPAACFKINTREIIFS